VKKLALAVGAGLVAIVIAVFGVLVLLFMGAADAHDSGGKVGGTSATALSDIPAELLPVYQAAATQTCNMRWQVLAAVGKIETDHGRSTLPGVHSGANEAGAMGPMQFLAGTWAAYGVDGNHDGTADVYDPVDSIWGAANYLCANGAGTGDERNALWNYNHADWYVDQVLQIAAGYTGTDGGAVSGSNADAVLNNPNITLCPDCRQDLLDGVIDQRVIDFLAWAAQNHQIAISVLKTGHSQFVHGTDRVSNHWDGRAADIYAVDGQEVTPSCEQCRAFAEEVVGLGAGRPDEMGVPWADMVGAGGWNVFSDGDHQDHIHVGWAAS